MDYFQAIFLGIIQGIAEWLPVSSEAMVTLAGKFFFGMEYSDALGMAIWLHAGTFLAALAYFRREIFEMARSLLDKGRKELLVFLVIATTCSGIIAAPLLFLAFSIALPDAVFTLLIGIFLVVVAFLQKNRGGGKEQSLEPGKAAIAGIIQGFSALPGLSRSGLTIAALLGERFSLKESFRLSFLMSLPVTLGVQLFLPLVKEGFQVTLPMVAGGIAAAAVGFVTIKYLMEFAERVSFFRATLCLGTAVIVIGIMILIGR